MTTKQNQKKKLLQKLDWTTKNERKRKKYFILKKENDKKNFTCYQHHHFWPTHFTLLIDPSKEQQIKLNWMLSRIGFSSFSIMLKIKEWQFEEETTQKDGKLSNRPPQVKIVFWKENLLENKQN